VIQPHQDLSGLWLPLVRRLTYTCPSWVVWKNADAAFAGSGDVDSAAPMREWGLVAGEFRAWSSEVGLGPVVVCMHPPRTMFLLSVDRERATFAELDVLARKYFRGWTLFSAEDLLPLAQVDDRGFRVIRPGAQALILLLTNGARWGGRRDQKGMSRRRIPQLLAEDLQGALMAAGLMKLPVEAVRRLADAVVGGSWDRRAMLRIEASAVARSFTEPGILAQRVRFKLLSKQRCPVLKSIFYDDRRIPGGVDQWLEEVARTHTVYWDDGNHG
jgi:hypothetical protein